MMTISGAFVGKLVKYRTVLEDAPFWNTSGDSINATPLAAPSGWVLTAIARSNPSRPAVTPFEILEDILQLPRQLSGLYNLLKHPRTVMSPKGASNEYLGLQFGWLPMIEDFRKIANWQNLAARRAQDLQRLYYGKGLRKKVRFGSDTQSGKGWEQFGGAGLLTIKAHCNIYCKRESWATVRWKPTSVPVYHPLDIRFNNELRRQVLGLTPEGLMLGAWKVLPWTWLIGWFTNIGDYLLVSSNSVPATYSSVCFMSQSTFILEPNGHSTTDLLREEDVSMSGHYMRIRKTRIVGGVPVPGFSVPFLDTFRLSVLGSLAIQRIRW